MDQSQKASSWIIFVVSVYALIPITYVLITRLRLSEGISIRNNMAIQQQQKYMVSDQALTTDAKLNDIIARLERIERLIKTTKLSEQVERQEQQQTLWDVGRGEGA